MSRTLFLSLIVLGLSALVFSDEYSSGISSFFEDSSSSSILESSSSPFPFESSSERECYPGEYRNGNTCEKCSQALNCGNCSNGHSCDSCKSNDFTLVDGRCEIDCEKKFKKGCSSCTEKKCIACNAEECCTEMKHHWNGNTCQRPEEAFGKGCLEADSTQCTKCTAQECCGSAKYFDYDHSQCKECTTYGANCATCTFGMCLTCGEGETVNGEGYCVTCSDLHNQGCLTCNAYECLTSAEGYLVQGSKAAPCNQVFGDACTKCGANGCEECSGNDKVFDGYCKSCTQVFGSDCLECDSQKCTQCSNEKQIVNGVCMSCNEAFGDTCAECKTDFTGCNTATENQGFIYANFAFKCEALSDEAAKDKCMGQGTRDAHLEAAPARYTRDAKTLNVEYDGKPYAVLCSSMTDHCANCEVKDGNAMCTECDDGYVLFGGLCKPCSEQLGNEYNCATCSQTRCTSCAEESNLNINAEGKCIACENGKIFETETKTCLDCGIVYSNCGSCDTDGKCESCTSNAFVLHDGKCKLCSEQFKAGCSKCTPSNCTECASDSCCEPGETIIIKNGEPPKCGLCSSTFGEKCNTCTAKACTGCAEGFATDDDSNCKACSELFEGCSACDSDHCTKCAEDGWKVTPNGCYKDEEEKPDVPVTPSSSSPKPEESKAGMIVGIVIGCIALIAIVAIAIYCFATAGAKRGKIDPVIYEEDPEFVSMSVL